MTTSRAAIAFELAALLPVLAVGTVWFLDRQRRLSPTGSYFIQLESGVA